MHRTRQLLDAAEAWAGPHGPDPRTAALVRVAASIALGATHDAYRRAVTEARATGASDDDVMATLHAVAATLGPARVVAAAPGLALALGYDVDAALEDPNGA